MPKQKIENGITAEQLISKTLQLWENNGWILRFGHSSQGGAVDGLGIDFFVDLQPTAPYLKNKKIGPQIFFQVKYARTSRNVRRSKRRHHLRHPLVLFVFVLRRLPNRDHVDQFIEGRLSVRLRKFINTIVAFVNRRETIAQAIP